MFCSWMTHSARWLQWKVRHLLSHPVSPWTCLGNHQSKVTGRAGTLPWQTVGETSVVLAVWIILSSHWTPLPLSPLRGLTRVACSWMLTSCLIGQHIPEIALIDALITSTGSNSLPCSSFFPSIFPTLCLGHVSSITTLATSNSLVRLWWCRDWWQLPSVTYIDLIFESKNHGDPIFLLSYCTSTNGLHFLIHFKYISPLLRKLPWVLEGLRCKTS